MPRTRVVHVLKADHYDVYIGRANPRHGLAASIWGNPFKVGRDGPTAEAVIKKYRKWLMEPEQAWLRQRLPELRGRVIACWCKPNWPCHGDVLAELADKGVCK